MIKNNIIKNNIIKKNLINFNFYKLKVYKSNKNFYCQIYSLFNFNIVFGISNISKILKNYIFFNFGKNLNLNVFYFLGKVLSFKLIKFKIFKIIFNKNKYKYHGCLKILSNSLREFGVIF